MMVMQQSQLPVSPSLDIIVRVDGKILGFIRHRLDRSPVLSQINIAGRRTQYHEIIGIADSFQRSKSLLEPHHIVIRLDL